MITVKASCHDDYAEVRFNRQPQGFIMDMASAIIHIANEHRIRVEPFTWDYEAAARQDLNFINGRPC